MNYSKKDINFNEISPRSFENLCYDLIVRYNFKNVIWRDGGADDGRDIQAIYVSPNPIRDKETKWYFECKHYTSGGVPPEHLNAKIAWADAGGISALVIFCSSTITNGARHWLSEISSTRAYDIIVIESEQLKDRIINYPDIIEQYFSQTRYEKLLKDFKDYHKKYDTEIGYQVLKEIVENIELAKLDDNDVAFLLMSFFKMYDYWIDNDYQNSFDNNVIKRLTDYLIDTSDYRQFVNLKKYNNDYDILGGIGMFDEFEYLDTNPDSVKEFSYQHYVFHLNYSQNKEKWKTGEYLFFIRDNTAFEIFQDEEAEISLIKNFTPDNIGKINYDRIDIAEYYKKYLAEINKSQ